MAKYRPKDMQRFSQSKTPFRHRPQLGLNYGFDVKKRALLAYTAGGSLIGPLVTDKGEPILF